MSRRHPQRFPQSPFGARFRIRDRAVVGRDATQPADLENTVGWKVANPLLQDELRRIGEFGAQQRIRNLPSNRVFEVGWLRRVATYRRPIADPESSPERVLRKSLRVTAAQ